MNEVCEQLAQTGLNTYVAIGIAASLVIGGYFGIRRRKTFFILVFCVLMTFGSGMVGVNINTALAQAADSCIEPNTTNTNTPQIPDNAAQALDDGPFTIGTSESNVVLVPVINNDSPGTSTFDLDTLDLNPSTPEIDYEFTYFDSLRSGTFYHYTNDGVVRFKPDTPLAIGDIISVPYTIKTVDGELAGPANIIIEVVEWIAQGDEILTCGSNEEMTLVLTDNDTHVSGINTSSVDLNPSQPGRQTNFTTPDGVHYEVEDNGLLIVTLPSGGFELGNFDSSFILYYTVQTNDLITSNSAPISIGWTGDCGST